MVAAGSVVAPRSTFPPNSLIRGSPATVVRPLTEHEVQTWIRDNASRYVAYAEDHRVHLAELEAEQ